MSASDKDLPVSPKLFMAFQAKLAVVRQVSNLEEAIYVFQNFEVTLFLGT